MSPTLLESLRVYWRWLKPRTYLFPSRLHRDHEQPISDKIVWLSCTQAAEKAGIRKRVSPHLVRRARGPRICWKPVPTCAPSSFAWSRGWSGGDGPVSALSAQHLQKVANPIEGLKLSEC